MQTDSTQFKIEEIANRITDAEITAYIEQGPRWLSIADVKGNAHLRQQVAYRVYAGRNPMQHHEREITHGGRDGARRLMARLGSPEAAKERAGAWIVSARWNRAQGRMKAARESLKRAAECRAFAAQVSRTERHSVDQIAA